MKSSFLIFISVVVLLIVALLFWRRPVQPPVAGRPTNAPVATATAVGQNTPSAAPARTRIPSVSQPCIVTHKVETPEQARKEIESANVPVDFYGRFIDQNSNAVSGVKIKISIRHWTMPDPTVQLAGSKTIYLERASDADGRFEFHDETGDAIYVESLQKDGYELSPKFSHNYGPNSGSFENPVVIKMWKMGGSQRLVSHRTLFGFQRDGRIYTLDLLDNKKIEGENADGDLRIKFQCPIIKPNQPYSWTLEISAVGGGLIETTDEFTYLAPASGYQSQVLLEATSVAPSAMPDFTKDYYITTRNGQNYGIVRLQIYSDYRGQSAILVESGVNPNGSRDLQP